MMIKREGAEVQTQPQTGSSPSKEGSSPTPLGCQDTLIIKHQSASWLMDYSAECVFQETGHSYVTLGKLLHPWALSFFTWKKREIMRTMLQSILRVQWVPESRVGYRANASHYHHLIIILLFWFNCWPSKMLCTIFFGNSKDTDLWAWRAEISKFHSTYSHVFCWRKSEYLLK